jgi:hypothetical protein
MELLKQTKDFIVIDGDKYYHYSLGTKHTSKAFINIEGIHWYKN